MPEETTKMSFGSRLQWAREQSGLSQGQAAKMLNIPKADLIGFEDETKEMTFKDKCRAANLYDMRLDWLIHGVEQELQGGLIVDAGPGGIDPAELQDVKTLLSRIRQDAKRHR